MTCDPRAFYRTHGAAAATAQAREERLMRRLSAARLALVGVVLLVAFAGARLGGSAAGEASPVGLAVAGAAFVVLVAVHARARRRHAAARARRRACEAGRARVARDWAATPGVRWTPPLDARRAALAHDLDVTGDVSLLRLLDVCNPTLGTARVLDWLLDDPSEAGVVAARADSVAALRASGDSLLAFATAAQARRGVPTRGIEHFAAWSRTSPGANDRSFARWLTVVTLGLTAVVVGSAVVEQARGTLMVPALVAQVVCAAAARRRLERDLLGVDDALTQLAGMIDSLRIVVAMPPTPGLFGTIQERLRRQGALGALVALRRLLDWNGVRYSPLGHWALNAAVGLDVHVWSGVVRWRDRHGLDAGGWIDAVADAEAQVALATLGFDNPDWSRAVVHERADLPSLEAEGLAHPLIAPEVVVRNDLRLDAGGDVVVVSGSNMAGKTTFLRAAGLGALLAAAGGPVCARSVAIRRCRVRTSVRIEDDPARGVSLFLAEAMRIQSVVREALDPARPAVLFLLDEILHGTNAEDRREAIRLVLRRLAATPAFGLVTTHDPEIARGVRPAGNGAGGGDARQLHFRETVSGDADSVHMEFDYVARPGPATSRNALTILRTLGLS